MAQGTGVAVWAAGIKAEAAQRLTGIKPTTQSLKKRPDRQPAKVARGRLAWFTPGIRRAH
jgi:hypothetical protein